MSWAQLSPRRRQLFALGFAAAYLLPLGVLQTVAAGPILGLDGRGFTENGPLAYAVLLAGLLLLLLAAKTPMASLTLIGFILTCDTFLHVYDPSAELITLDVIAFVVVARGRRHELAVAVAFSFAVNLSHSAPWRAPVAIFGYNTGFFAAAIVAGIASLRSREALEALVEARQALADQRAREVAQARLLERSAIAAELQPFVLSGVRDMTIRARHVKRALRAGKPVPAVDLQGIEQAGRACLADLRRVLSVLTAAVNEIGATPLLGSSNAAGAVMPGRRSRLAGWPADVTLTAIMCALALNEQFTLGGGNGGPLSTQRTVAITVAPVLPLLLRRRLPLLAPVLNLTGEIYLYSTAPTYETVSTFITVFILAYSAAAYAGRRGAVLGLCVAVGQLLGSFFGQQQFDHRFAAGVLGPLLVQSLFAAAAGLLVRQQRALAAEVGTANAGLSAGRERELGIAVVLERLQIARDMHDVVGHGITVMVVQSGAARALAHRDVERALTSLREVERGGRVALAELNSLTRASPVAAGLASVMDKAAITALITKTAGASISVDLAFTGRSRALEGPSAVALQRVLVEAVTNAIKYGDGSARVRVSYTGSGVKVAADNRLRSNVIAAKSVALSGGMGILGMRERLQLLGGYLVIDQHDGRFQLSINLPWATTS